MSATLLSRAIARAAMGALVIAASPLAAQVRDLDREAPAGRVFQGAFGLQDAPATFALALPAGQALQVEALPVGGSDPEIRVFDARTGELLAHNDDQAGTIAARVRLYSASDRAVRIEVARSASSFGPDSAARFTLVILPTERPRPPQPIEIGGRYAGELAAGDEQLFQLQAERGQLLDLSLIAPPGSALDPQLEVYAGDGAIGEALAQDDDGAGNLDAHLQLVVPEAGTYTVRATAVGSSAGAFELLTEPGARMRSAPAERLELGQVIEGELTPTDEARFYRLSESALSRIAEAGGSLIIEMTSEPGSQIDPLLEAGFDTPFGFSPTRSDDDSGGELNARLALDLGLFDDRGDWLGHLRIKAGSTTGGVGAYRIKLELFSTPE